MSSKKHDIIVVGELNVDIILNNIESFPVIGKEILANDLTLVMGSSSAIFACNLSSLGTNVAFIGKLGTDFFGQFIVNKLEDRKVDTSNIIKSVENNTGATIVLNYDQDRAMVTYQGAMSDLKLKDIHLDILSQASHLHFSSCFLQPGIKNNLVDLFKAAKERGLTTSMDPQWDPSEKWELPLEELLPYVDVFLPNNAEIQALTNTNNIEAAINTIKNFSNYIVVKNGSEGACCWNGKEIVYQKSFLNKNVVDCIGAGDSFNAGFISKFVKKESIQNCLEFAALTGAINTTKSGGTAAFESIEAIRKVAKESFEYSF